LVGVLRGRHTYPLGLLSAPDLLSDISFAAILHLKLLKLHGRHLDLLKVPDPLDWNFQGGGLLFSGPGIRQPRN